MDHASAAGLGRGMALLGAAALALVACGIGDKAALEERITGAPGRFGSDFVTGFVHFESRLVEVPEGVGLGGVALPGLPGGGDIPDGGVVVRESGAAFTLDLPGSRATVRRAPGDPPLVVMDDLVFYGRRAGVPDDDARPWVRLALSDVTEDAGEIQPFDDGAAGVAFAFHPALLVDLVAGTLTGSIDAAGTEEVNGVETTRYDVNISVRKALGDVRRDRYPEERREQVEELIELLAIDGDVHPGEVWLDGGGIVRRFSIRFRQEPQTRVEFDMVVTVDILDVGGAFDASVPEPREVLSVDSVARFVTTVTGGSGDAAIPPSVAATLGGAGGSENGSGNAAP